MQAKVPPRRTDGGSSIDLLTRYMREVRKAALVVGENLISVDTAAAEMRAVAALRPDVEDPWKHIILTWPVGEHPTNEQMVAAARHALKKLGYEEHQAIISVHQDRDHWHVHIAVNKIHPVTLRSHTPRMDWLTLDYACREIEIEQGWSQGRGRFATEWLGNRPVIVERDGRTFGRLSDKALAFERFSGEMSFSRWVGQGEVAKLIDECATWEDVHDELFRHGLEFERTDQGLRIRTIDGDERCVAKASHISETHSLPALEKRLGEYVANARELDLEPQAILVELTEKSAFFSEADLDRYLRRNVRQEAWEKVKRRIVEHAECVHLEAEEVTDDDGSVISTRARFTTRTVRTEEEGIKRAAEEMHARKSPIVINQQAVEEAIKKRTMREDQLDALRRALAAGGIACWQGRAGVGKSYAMSALREVYEASGCRVIGMAPTNSVISDMRSDGFGDARTIHSALASIKHGKLTLDDRTVILVDEAGMVDTPILSQFMAAVNEAGTTVRFIGDDRQLPSVSRGGMFAELSRRYGAGEIHVITRQQVEWQNQAATAMSNYNFEAACALFYENGGIRWGGNEDEALDLLVGDWEADTAAAKEDGKPLNYAAFQAFAYTNAEVDIINAACRAIREARGELGDSIGVMTKHGPTTFSVGDRTVFTSTDKGQGVVNGATGEVIAVDARSKLLTIRLDGGKVVTIQPGMSKESGQIDGVRHGYCTTIHKSQGRTINNVYLKFSHRWGDALSYVAGSRQKLNARIYAARETAADWRAMARIMATSQTKHASVTLDVAAEKHAPRDVFVPENHALAPKSGETKAEAAPAPEAAANAEPASEAPAATADEAPAAEAPKPKKRRGGFAALAEEEEVPLPPPPEEDEVNVYTAAVGGSEKFTDRWKKESEEAYATANAAWQAQVTAWREDRDRERLTLDTTHKAALDQVRQAPMDPETRAAAIMVLREAARTEIRAHADKFAEARKALGNPPLRETLEAWTKRHAAAGDAEAKRRLRGAAWAEKADRRAGAEAAKAATGMPAPNTRDELYVLQRLPLTDLLTEAGYRQIGRVDGTTVYRRGQRDIVVRAQQVEIDGAMVEWPTRWYSLSDSRQAGSAIDFVRFHQGQDGPIPTSKAKAILRGKLTDAIVRTARSLPIDDRMDIVDARRLWDGARRATSADLAAYGLAGTVPPEARVDAAGNLLVPHTRPGRDGERSVTGYEIHSVRDGERKYFSLGGMPQTAQFGEAAQPARIVVVDTAIDALRRRASDADADATLYISTGGLAAATTRSELRQIVEAHPAASIEIAVHARQHTEVIREALGEKRDVTIGQTAAATAAIQAKRQDALAAATPAPAAEKRKPKR